MVISNFQVNMRLVEGSLLLCLTLMSSVQDGHSSPDFHQRFRYTNILSGGMSFLHHKASNQWRKLQLGDDGAVTVSLHEYKSKNKLHSRPKISSTFWSTSKTCMGIYV